MKKTKFLAPLAVTGFALALSACQTTGPVATVTTSAPTATSSSTATVTTSASSTATETVTAKPSDSTTPSDTAKPTTSQPTGSSQPPDGPLVCPADQLKLKVVDDPEGSGAGHIGRRLTVTNTGGNCYFPGGAMLQLLSGDKLTIQQVKVTTSELVLASGESASSALSFAQVGNFPDCRPTPVAKIALKSGDTLATVDVDGLKACPGKDILEAKPLTKN